MRACGAPPRFELKKLIWLSSGLESWSVNATRRPSTGETIGLLVSPILAWKPVGRGGGGGGRAEGGRGGGGGGGGWFCACWWGGGGGGRGGGPRGAPAAIVA